MFTKTGTVIFKRHTLLNPIPKIPSLVTKNLSINDYLEKSLIVAIATNHAVLNLPQKDLLLFN